MFISFIHLVLLLGIPVLVNRMEKSSRIVRWLSPMIICYLVGIIIGNIPGLPLNKELLEYTYGVSVYLAIPLLLFSANFKRMLNQVRPAFFAFFLGVIGVIISAVLAFWIFRDQVPQPAAASGMMIGVYTGGTPNMSAIGVALGVDEEVFVLLNSADIVFTGIYFIFLITVGKTVLGLFLPNHKKDWNNHATEDSGDPESSSGQSTKHVISGLLLAVATLVVAAGFSRLILRNWSIERAIPLIILGITTLGIAASFQPRIRRLPHTYSTANYLLLVFALAMGSMADFKELLASSSNLFLFCGFVVLCSVLIHFILAFIFRLDRDTVIIASTAAIFGPPFIGPVASAIGNREIIAFGIALGLMGIAMGNYLGLGLAFLLK